MWRRMATSLWTTYYMRHLQCGGRSLVTHQLYSAISPWTQEWRRWRVIFETLITCWATWHTCSQILCRKWSRAATKYIQTTNIITNHQEWILKSPTVLQSLTIWSSVTSPNESVQPGWVDWCRTHSPWRAKYGRESIARWSLGESITWTPGTSSWVSEYSELFSTQIAPQKW